MQPSWAIIAGLAMILCCYPVHAADYWTGEDVCGGVNE